MPLAITVLHGALFVRTYLEIIDIPLHFLIDFIVVCVTIMRTLQLLLRILIKIPFPFFLFHVFLLPCEKLLLILLVQILTYVILELLTLPLANQTLLLKAYFGSFLRYSILLYLIQSI